MLSYPLHKSLRSGKASKDNATIKPSLNIAGQSLQGAAARRVMSIPGRDSVPN
jgi:hypothetical protein